jgi:hypothetical protein
MTAERRNEADTLNPKRPVSILLRITEAERDLIAEKMAAANMRNREAYIRKMVLDGYVVRVDFSDVRELSRLLRTAANNLNQISRRANETRSIYESDIKDLQDNYEKLWQSAEIILKKLAKL